MLVDQAGGFLSQRTVPRMALLRVEIGADGLVVRAPGMPDLTVPDAPVFGTSVRVEIWGDECDATMADAAANSWFSEFLGLPSRLVHIPDDSLRTVDPDYAEPADRVGFADGFPFLLASEASLADLSQRAGTDLPMNRFRPNLVVSGIAPYAEDGWSRIRVGDVSFRVVKPCARCSVTTVDQETAEVGKEPLRTLATFRKVGSKVMFGQNLLHDGTGTLRVGDPVSVEGLRSER